MLDKNWYSGNSFLLAQRNVLGENFQKNSTLSEKFSDLGETFSAGMLKLYFTFPEKHFEEIIFFRKIIFIIFGLSENFPDFQQKFYVGDCQKCILRVHRNILGFEKKLEHVHSELADSGEKKINRQREKMLS